MRSHRLRYLQSLQRRKIAGVAALGALSVVAPACSSNDAQVFNADTSVAEATISSTTVAESATTFAATSAEHAIAFTYAPTSAGKQENPYVAVWMEDASGTLIRTIALWYEQSGKGSRWLRHLRSWYDASSGNPTSTGATKSPGTYSLVWDGTDENGVVVAAGQYTIFVETAREKGPYSISSAQITVGSGAYSITIPNNGELSGLSISSQG